MFCTACGAASTAGAKFCASCGAPRASAPAGVEERRVVTIVFCDLVGSTALSGQLDPEVLRSVTLRYFELMSTRLKAHGGTVEKFIGDAVMAVFGVPSMHEDDARRALAATLDMTAALAEFNLELGVSLDIRLDVRIGVNTGEVIATVDPAAGQVLVSGEVVNVAARLEQNAEPGQILIGEQTMLAAGAAAQVEAAGALQLKGKTGTVVGYRLLGLLSDDPEVLRRFDVPFVGREQELAELRLMLDRVGRQRSCHLVNIYGEAGIGKTRLMRIWQQGLDPALVRLGTGRCRPYGDAGTLSALADAVGQLLIGTREGLPADALDILDTGLLKDGTPNPSVSETVGALASVISALAQQRTVLLSLDDCHWAPPMLLDVLDELAEYLDHEAVLLACVARPDLLDHRPGWGSGRLNANSMVLQGLSADETMLLAGALVEVSAHDAEICERIIDRAEGNPLHLEQLFASVGADGSKGPLPPTVYALLAARIDALDAPERLLLDLAAIIGREFDATGLRTLAAVEADTDCTPALRELSRRRLIEPLRRPGGPPNYRFSSGLIQEVAYKGMAKRIRSERHERFAGCLREGGGTRAELAGHLERAYRYRAELGVADSSTETLRSAAAAELGAAGGTALAHADLCWAEDLLSRAVQLLRPAEPSWAPIAQRLAEVQLALGRRQDGLTLLPQVLEAAERNADPATAAHARLQLATHAPAVYGSAADAARAGLAVFERADDQLGLARAGVRIAQERQFQGRHGDAEAMLLDAVEHAGRADAEPERAMALGAVGVSLWCGPTPAELAIARAQELLAEHGPNRSTVRATLNCPLAVLFALRDQPDEAEACLQIAGPIARSLGFAEAEVFIPLFSAIVANLGGDPGQAEALLRGALRACDRLGDVGLVSVVSRDLARLLLERGSWQEPAELIAGEGEQVSGAPSEAADQLGVRARIAALRGDTLLALELVERALEQAERTDSPISRGMAQLDLAQVLRAQGSYPAAAEAARTAGKCFADKGHLVGNRRAIELAELLATTV
jgi:class 3 adenylate cyclase/tetratricopeptide (TPR) repeat protein